MKSSTFSSQADLTKQVNDTIAILQARISQALERVDTILNKLDIWDRLNSCRIRRSNTCTAEEITEIGVDMHECLPMFRIPNGPGLGIVQIGVGGRLVERSHILLNNRERKLSSPGSEVLPRNQETRCRLSFQDMAWITCFCDAAEDPEALQTMLEEEIARIRSVD